MNGCGRIFGNRFSHHIKYKYGTTSTHMCCVMYDGFLFALFQEGVHQHEVTIYRLYLSEKAFLLFGVFINI